MQQRSQSPAPSERSDWRDPEQYRPLLDLDHAGWAAEWLRRAPDFPAIATGFADLIRTSEPAPDRPRVILMSGPPVGAGWGLLLRRCGGAGRYLLASVAGTRRSCCRCLQRRQGLAPGLAGSHPVLCLSARGQSHTLCNKRHRSPELKAPTRRPRQGPFPQ